jgi:ribulose-5-phosphate 4-epimerase/fuculose-1-phosphate aldolase
LIRDEGVIKFDCRFQKAPALSMEQTKRLIEYRQRLFALNLIGVYPDGIGFGNISERSNPRGQFIISASQTGHLRDVDAQHFSLVTKYSIEGNWLECRGVQPASSESLTHAMIYQQFPHVDAVIHVHHHAAWHRLQDKVPTTAAEVPYGTPAMATEVARLAADTGLPAQKIFVMAGHEDGIISFGAGLEEAFRILIDNLQPELA